MHMNIRINIVKIDKMVYNIYRGDIMQIIDQMIAEIVNLFIDFLSKYWLLGGGIILGFFFRCDLYKTKIVIPELRRRKVLTTIVYVMGLTIMWSLLYSNQQDSNIGISTLILTLVYLFVVVAEKCDDGTTESLLLIVNGTMITTLSFQPFPYNIGFALLTILVAWIAYKCWFSLELLSDLLQKILYYVKAISKIFEGESFILEPCEAWKFGPVFPSVYEKYREFGKQEIKLNLSKDYISELLSEEEKTVTDFVMNTFGIYNAWFLKDLTHLEEPWIVARKGLAEDDASRNQMDEEIISNYFAKMNQMYDLKTAVGVEVYINHMKKEM